MERTPTQQHARACVLTARLDAAREAMLRDKTAAAAVAFCAAKAERDVAVAECRRNLRVVPCG